MMKTVCPRARGYSEKRAPHPRGRARTGTKQLSVLDHRTRLERWLSRTANFDGRVVYRRHRSTEVGFVGGTAAFFVTAAATATGTPLLFSV